MTVSYISNNPIDSYISTYQNEWLGELQSQSSYQYLKITKKVSGLICGMIVALSVPEASLMIYMKCPKDKAYGSSKKVTFPFNSRKKIAFCELRVDQRADSRAKLLFQVESEMYKLFEKSEHVLTGLVVRYRRWNPQGLAMKSEIREALILENMSLGSLSDCIMNGIDFSKKEFKKIAIEIAKGVRELHKENISHNDLKPENILVRPNGSKMPIAKLADLQFVEKILRGHSRRGSPSYTSPEKLLNLSRIGDGLKDDIWSLGITFSELLKGNLPTAIRKIRDWHELLCCMTFPEKIRGKEPVKSSFRHLIWTMLDPKPALRPSIQKVIEALEELPESDFIFIRCPKINAANLRLTKSYPQ